MASRPLTIVMGCDTFSPDVNGAARFAERLAAGLVARGHAVHVIAPSANHRQVGTFTETIEGEQVTVHRARSWRWYPHDWLRFVLPWRVQHYARETLKHVDADVVHIQSHINVGRGLSLVAAKRGIRQIATNHIMPENLLDFTRMPDAFNRWLVRRQWQAARRVFVRGTAVTTPTRRAADFLEQNTGLTGVLPVSCGIDAGNYVPDLGPREQHRLLFVGRLTSEKQVDVMLDALAKLPPEIHADLVGGGDRVPDLQRQVTRLGITDRVVFHGQVPDAELREIYTRASIFVMPSIAELQSIATLEAMASGLVIVAADAMALPHLVENGVNGWLFPPGDVDTLVARIQSLLALPDAELERMRRASLQGVVAHDIQRTLDTFEALYVGAPVPV